jgi:hypothetical protein
MLKTVMEWFYSRAQAHFAILVHTATVNDPRSTNGL